VITTPGGESNVKEIFDKCRELKRNRKDIVIFNQFDEPGNYLWHYEVTGQAMFEMLLEVMSDKDSFAGIVLTTGSAGTLGSGDYLKEVFPGCKIAVGEPLQCPTLMLNGYGEHRIEGIGDKHVPWIHNIRNTDMVMCIDDSNCVNLIRLFNEPTGKEYLVKQGVPEKTVDNLHLLGISGVGNLISAVKFCKYYELSKNEFVVTVFTDSMELYGSRLKEYSEKYGKYTENDAIKDYHRYLMGISTVHMLELSYYDKKRIHNLKYYTWIEQQGKDVKELNAQWHDYPEYWKKVQAKTAEIDRLINEFNEKTGLLNNL